MTLLSFRGADVVREPGIHNHGSLDLSAVVRIVVMGSGLLAEPVIGPRFARTRWLGPGTTAV